MILSNEGKPNPYDNFNSAPVLINPVTNEVIYTPLYYLLCHFSKFIRPGAHRIDISGEQAKGLIYTAALNPDNSIAVVVYNKTEEVFELELGLANESYPVKIAARALQTIKFTRK
jgi:glucosylceramidase